MKNYLGILFVFGLTACNSSSDKSTKKMDTIPTHDAAKTIEQPVFKEPKVSEIYTSYLDLKDALIAGKSEEAKTAAQSLAVALKNYTGCENTSLIAQKIVTAKDVADQRKQFTDLSTDVIALFKHADFVGGAIYVQHCPMANNGEGGDWIAAEKKIQNPYYGKEMLECGAVITEIKAK